VIEQFKYLTSWLKLDSANGTASVEFACLTALFAFVLFESIVTLSSSVQSLCTALAVLH
jgi:Flp pilus assembly pilin Flp